MEEVPWGEGGCQEDLVYVMFSKSETNIQVVKAIRKDNHLIIADDFFTIHKLIFMFFLTLLY